MNQSTLVRRAGICIMAVLIAAGAQAGDQHHPQTSHVHGKARLNLVIDGKVIHIELIGPAASLVGFEHTPTSEAEHAAIRSARSTLEDGDRLFRFNESADCRMEQMEIASGLAPNEGTPDQDTHPDHDPHDAQHLETQHSDITAVYRFVCGGTRDPDKLYLGLFDAFPAFDELDVQHIAGSRQSAAKVSKNNPTLDL